MASVYEVIPPAAQLRPYFDLEYDRAANPGRTATADQAVVQHIFAAVDVFSLEQGLDARVLHDASVVLDASDAGKFSQHVVVHLSGRQGLCGVAQAKAVCSHVVASMPQDLLAVQTASGRAGCIIDQSVYSSNQQMRIMGCVKLGSDRVLRVLQPADCNLEGTLVCMPQHGLLWPKKEARALQCASTSMGMYAGSSVLQPAIAHAISSSMGGSRIRGCALHTAHGSQHPSIYVYTTSTSCAHVHHKSNTALAEISCSSRHWRVLCRDGCKPGEWQLLPGPAADCIAASSAPAWLRAHCAKWQML
jgi:hypothetical protein